MKSNSSPDNSADTDNKFPELFSSAEVDERYCANVRNHHKRALIFAMQALYQVDVCKVNPRDALRDVLQYEREPWAIDFIKRAVFAVCEDQPEIDSILSSHITCNWSIERLASVERNLLRLGTFIIRNKRMMPSKKAVDLICQISSEYATDRSAKLLRGILSCIRAEVSSGAIPSLNSAPQQADRQADGINEKDETSVLSAATCLNEKQDISDAVSAEPENEEQR